MHLVKDDFPLPLPDDRNNAQRSDGRQQGVHPEQFPE